MTKSLARRLLPATLLFALTIVMLLLCAAALVLIDAAVARDLDHLGAMAGALREIDAAAAGVAALASQNPAFASQEAAGASLRARIDAANEELRAAAAAAGATATGELVYPSDLVQRMEETRLSALTGLQDVLENFRSGGSLKDFSPPMARLRDGIGEARDEAAGVRRSALRVVLALFAVFTLFGGASALSYALYAQGRLGRDLAQLAACARRIAEGDASARADLGGEDEIGEISRALGRLGSVAAALAQARHAMGRLSDGVRLIAESAETTGATARGQAEAAAEAGRGLPVITHAVGKVAQGAATGLAAAGEGGRSVERLLERIRANVDGTHSLEQSTSRIEEVVSLIGDVADQTELLSLNAAIEAARAGEAGRGFTVVAQQVRKLADRSARAASEISGLVESILGVVKTIAADSRDSLDAVEVFQRDLAGISRSILDISELAQGASKDADPTARSIERMRGLAAQSSRSAQDLAARGRSLLETTEQLGRSLAELPSGATAFAVAAVTPAVAASAVAQLAITPVAEPAPETVFLESDADLVELPEAGDDAETTAAFPVEELPRTGRETSARQPGDEPHVAAGGKADGEDLIEELEAVEEE